MVNHMPSGKRFTIGCNTVSVTATLQARGEGVLLACNVMDALVGLQPNGEPHALGQAIVH